MRITNPDLGDDPGTRFNAKRAPMTVTIKLDPLLEEQLRQRARRSGRSTSEVVRAALQAYLAQPEPGPPRSAFELGVDLFGRHSGSPDLASRRKQVVTDAWEDRHARRGT